MIKKLRFKFIAVAMGSLCAILLLLFFTITITISLGNEKQADLLMGRIAREDGAVPSKEFVSPNNEFRRFPGKRDFNRSFSIRLDHNNQIIDLIDYGTSNLSSKEVNALLKNVLKKDKHTGSINEYQYHIANKNYGKIVVFTDYSIENTILKRLINTILVVGGIGIIIIFVFVIALSYWATKPVQIAFDRQKQFISDASHELKTPLTVIAANASVLESSIGRNKWLSHIQSNMQRMNLLINDLLNLTKLDNAKQTLAFSKFNLSKAFLNCALPFESTAFEGGKDFRLDIADDIQYYGSEESIKQMLVILLDNAFKYSDPNGIIKASLSISNDRKLIKIYNTGIGIAKEDYEKIFERFYRSDSSRSRDTGGYGLGLAIAKSIVEAHKGQISVNSIEGQWVEFSVIL